MTIELQDLTTIDPALVTQKQTFLTQLVQEDDPTLEVRRGVVHDYVLHNEAILAAATATNIARYNSARSLQQISTDPTLADDSLANEAASNFLTTRLPGLQAQGQVLVVLSANQSLTIPAGAIFVAGANQFTADAVTSGQPTAAALLSPSDVLLTPLDDGTFAFPVAVTAVAVGATSRLTKNTLALLQNPPPLYLTSYAASDFIGGTDAQDNAALLQSLQRGISCQSPSSRSTLDALVVAQSEFENLGPTSVIGFGDGEMLRDRHWIWPTSGGGRIDYYARTAERALLTALTKTATLIGQDAATGAGLWQFSLGRDEVPGFYDIPQIQQTNSSNVAGTYTITSEIRSFDLTGLDPVPDILTVAEGAFSRYQTATVQFLDPDTSLTGLVIGSSTRDYAVTVRGLPLLHDLQVFLSGRRSQSYASDLLVKAPIPCFLQLSFNIQRQAGTAVPDVASIKDRLAQTVNRYGFTGRLPASLIADVTHDFLQGSAAIAKLDMFGMILRPDGSLKPLRSGELLLIPTESATMVSPRTVNFFLDPADIAIALEIVSIPQI